MAGPQTHRGYALAEQAGFVIASDPEGREVAKFRSDADHDGFAEARYWVDLYVAQNP